MDRDLRNALLVVALLGAYVLVLLLASEHRSQACFDVPAEYGGTQCVNTDGYSQEPGPPAGNAQAY